MLLRKIYNYYFHHMKLKSKFIFSHLFLALAPTMIFAFFAYHQLFNIITNNTLQSLQAISQQTASSVESSISYLDTAITTIEENVFFRNFLRNLPSAPDAVEADFQEELAAFTESVTYLLEENDISAVRVYLDEAHYSFIQNFSQDDIYTSTENAQGTYWNGIFSSSYKTSLFCPSIYLSPYEIENYGELAIIHKITYYHDTSQEYAYVAFYFSQEVIDSILLQDSPFTNSVIYILNERDAIVSTTNNTLSGLYHIPYHDVPKSLSSTYNFETLQIGGENVYMGYKPISGTDWYMITVIPSNNLFEEGRMLLFQFIALYVLILLIGIVIALLLSNSIVKRISSVIHQMKQVRSGAPVQLEIEAGSDEIGDLIGTYNYMTDEINQLMNKQLESANDLRISEFKALQAQINPHFLYNTLDMINWMAKSGQTEDVTEAIQALSRFYKLTLNKGNITIRVKEELEHVSLYVQLQNMRYNNKIHFFVDVPDEMNDYEIPKLVFQPIVENSILHGIFEKESKEGNIVIMGWQEKDTLVFVISDNGVGIPPEKMTHLLDGTGQNSTGSNIGIYNTHRRLQLYYNTPFGLSYRSEPGVETEVEIRIPARKYE